MAITLSVCVLARFITSGFFGAVSQPHIVSIETGDFSKF
jgi:hypothetical protein